MFHVVTVVHNPKNTAQASTLAEDIKQWGEHPYHFTVVNNSVENRGFAAGCNLGASLSDEPFLAFLNPDLRVVGKFMSVVAEAFRNPHVVVAGESFGKPAREMQIWGVQSWVCGAAFFVRRAWWDHLGGFDERYVWSHEETDFIRRTEFLGKRVQALSLPFVHSSPVDDSHEDSNYKQYHFDRAARIYREKWGYRG